MAVNGCLIRQAIASERFQVSVIDCSFVPKCGKATYYLSGLFAAWTWARF